MHVYGTDVFWLEKSGQVSPGMLRTLAATAFMGVSALDKRHRQRLLAEAEAMNQEFRMAESQRMAPVKNSLMGKTGSAEVADRAGRRLAHQELDKVSEVEKEAIFRMLLQKGLGMVGKGLSAGGKQLGGGLGRTLRSQGAAARSAALGHGVPAPMGLSQGARQGFTSGLSKATSSPWAAQAAKGAPAAAPAAAAATAASGAKSKPFKLLGTGTKLKLLGAGAIGLAGYTGMKGLQSARDYMMTPAGHGSRWGAFGPAPPAGVNEYGYVTPYT